MKKFILAALTATVASAALFSGPVLAKGDSQNPVPCTAEVVVNSDKRSNFFSFDVLEAQTRARVLFASYYTSSETESRDSVRDGLSLAGSTGCTSITVTEHNTINGVLTKKTYVLKGNGGAI